jgi:hypothetical protein
MERTTETFVGTLPPQGYFALLRNQAGIPLIGWGLKSRGEAVGIVVRGGWAIPVTDLTEGEEEFMEYIHESELGR